MNSAKIKRRLLFTTLLLVLIGLIYIGVRKTLEIHTWLEFPVHITVNSNQRSHITLEVHNRSRSTFPGDKFFQGLMEIRSADGDLLARANTRQIGAINPGGSAFVIGWEGELQPGSYQLIWGSTPYGYSLTNFDVYTQNGRLQFGLEQETRQVSAREALPESKSATFLAKRLEEISLDLAGLLQMRKEQIFVSKLDAEAPANNPAEQVYRVVLRAEDMEYLYLIDQDGFQRLFTKGNKAETARVEISNLQIVDSTSVIVSGKTSLPNTACIQTRMLEDGKELQWWPVEECARIENGQWEVKILMKIGNASTYFNPKAQYSILAWWKQKPEQKTIYFVNGT